MIFKRVFYLIYCFYASSDNKPTVKAIARATAILSLPLMGLGMAVLIFNPYINLNSFERRVMGISIALFSFSVVYYFFGRKKQFESIYSQCKDKPCQQSKLWGLLLVFTMFLLFSFPFAIGILSLVYQM